MSSEVQKTLILLILTLVTALIVFLVLQQNFVEVLG
mgnify:CR=1 FL=1